MTLPTEDAGPLLASLGVHRISVPVPFADAGGPVNVYAIEEVDGGFALFDSGTGTPDGEAALREGLARAGLSVASLRRIILSHGHVDHYGNAQALAKESGAEVLIHPADWNKVAVPNPWPELKPVYKAYLDKLGVPVGLLEHIELLRDMAEAMGTRVEPARMVPLEPGLLRFKHFDAEVLHLPGHTPGLVCLWARKEKVLFADDHVLARVSPNPLLDLTQGDPAAKFRSLSSYLASARRVLELDVLWVLPGHGLPFRDVRGVLNGLFDFYARRQEKILAFLRAHPSSAYELIDLVFGKQEPIRLFLTLSEVIGNLEVLEDTQRVTRFEENGVYRFRATS